MGKPVIILRSIMRRKVCRAAGREPFVLPAYPWLIELVREKGVPKREWEGGRLILKWDDTEASWPIK